MPTSGRACRNTGRWGEVGLRLGSRGEARQMRHILFWFASYAHVALVCLALTTCLCYLTGINGESSFERDLVRRAPGCEVWGYDYSVTGVRTPCPFFSQ
jgi:hypothetical protein